MIAVLHVVGGALYLGLCAALAVWQLARLDSRREP